jgi:Asp-tRNA(Asn)/Glu-tRNA(Gln) amidotransferase A subunit family amidase
MSVIRSVMMSVLSSYALLILDDPEKYEGGPVGLQVIGRKFEEEKILDILEIIAQTLGEIE